MLSNRLLMAASWYGHSDGSGQGVELLYMGLWQVAGQLEPEPIPKEQTLAPFSFSDISTGVIRTLGLIGEWYATPSLKEQTLAPFSFSDISTGIIRTLGSIGEWYTTPSLKEPYIPYDIDISTGIIRTLGSIGEWYTTPLFKDSRLQYPGYSYMDIVLSEL